MQIVTVPIGQVKPYAGNPRIANGAVEKVAASLREFGWRQPIVVAPDMVVVVGHQRLAAAKSLGMTEVPVHIAEGLSKAQLRAYRLADNRSAEESAWDDYRPFKKNKLVRRADIEIPQGVDNYGMRLVQLNQSGSA